MRNAPVSGMVGFVTEQLNSVVIPAAGLGTRFLPAAKAVPKEMLPVVDTPAIQLVVEEAVAAGAKKVVLIAGRNKEAIEDHFDHAFELESTLQARGKGEQVAALQSIASLASVISIRQKRPLGLGHAVLCAKSAIHNEAFGVLLGDDLVDSQVPCLLQLWRAYLKHKTSVVALMPVPQDEIHRYGVAGGTTLDDGCIRIDKIVEKPKADPPSNLAVIGRYVLTPAIFEILENTTAGVGGEIQLTDALAVLAARQQLIGVRFEGTRHDVGDKLGYVQATVAYALKRAEMKAPLLAYLRTLVNQS
jgi:UTP--glucose-1-phosphate uridylyltransferase